MKLFSLIRIDPFLLILITVVITASLFPCQGIAKPFLEDATTFAIALLFFMHGAKLPFDAIVTGINHWRLHLFIFSITFLLFPILGVALSLFVPTLLPQNIYTGFLFLCTLPATVQSAIAFTSIARGNVAAAICSASASTLLGIFITPLLISLLLSTQSIRTVNIWESISAIMFKLMLPFIVGHLSRRFIRDWVVKHKKLISKTDRASILLVVYVAFSDAVVNGIWTQVDYLSLSSIILFSILLLLAVLTITTYSARLLGFSKQDEITIVFCGSKKSLVSGIPMASVIFPISTLGIMVLPLMIFHQIQLMICAILAAKYANRKI